MYQFFFKYILNWLWAKGDRSPWSKRGKRRLNVLYNLRLNEDLLLGQSVLASKGVHKYVFNLARVFFWIFHVHDFRVANTWRVVAYIIDKIKWNDNRKEISRGFAITIWRKKIRRNEEPQQHKIKVRSLQNSRTANRRKDRPICLTFQRTISAQNLRRLKSCCQPNS